MGGIGCKLADSEKGDADIQSGASNIRQTILNTLETYSENETTNAEYSQNIEISQSDEYYENMKLPKYNKRLFRPKGASVLGIGSAKQSCGLEYGCAYKIDQDANVKISTYKGNISESVSDISSKLVSKLKAEVDLVGGQAGKSRQFAGIENRVKDSVQKRIEKLPTVNNMGENFNTVIVQDFPAKCNSPCDWGMLNSMSGPTINQSAHGVVAVNDIMESYENIKQEYLGEIEVETEYKQMQTTYLCGWGYYYAIIGLWVLAIMLILPFPLIGGQSIEAVLLFITAIISGIVFTILFVKDSNERYYMISILKKKFGMKQKQQTEGGKKDILHSFDNPDAPSPNFIQRFTMKMEGKDVKLF